MLRTDSRIFSAGVLPHLEVSIGNICTSSDEGGLAAMRLHKHRVNAIKVQWVNMYSFFMIFLS